MSGTASSREPIVVGIDHTAAGSAAVRWAVREAVNRGTRLVVVHAYDRTSRADLAVERDPVGEPARERVEMQRLLLDVLADERAEVAVSFVQEERPVLATLADFADGATLVVVGQPTGAGQHDLPAALARIARCPVAVVDEDGAVRFAGRVVRPPDRGSDGR